MIVERRHDYVIAARRHVCEREIAGGVRSRHAGLRAGEKDCDPLDAEVVRIAHAPADCVEQGRAAEGSVSVGFEIVEFLHRRRESVTRR